MSFFNLLTINLFEIIFSILRVNFKMNVSKFRSYATVK